MKKTLNILKVIITLIAVIIGFFLLILSVGLDLAYSKRINCTLLQDIIEKSKSFLIPIGFKYRTVKETLSGSMGISFTTLSLLLSMGINLSNRFEVKIFGIPRWELRISATHKIYNTFRVLIYIFPFIMLTCINLDLCITGYLILFYNMSFLMIEYIFIAGSYQWKNNSKHTVNKLIQLFQSSGAAPNRDYMEYQVWLEEIRFGIEKTEGWQKAEQLCEQFIQHTSKFEIEKCYVSTYLFFDIIFCRCSQNKTNNSALRCIKKYIYSLSEKNTEDWNEIIFSALIKAAFKYWSELQIIIFLNWFLDFAGRGMGGNNKKIEYIKSKQLIQINILLVMIEEWNTQQKNTSGLLYAYLPNIWFRGDLSNQDSLYPRLFKIIHNTDRYLTFEENTIIKSYENLRDDYKINRGVSFIGNTIRMKK